MMFWPFSVIAASMAAKKAQKEAQQAKLKEKQVVYVAPPPRYTEPKIYGNRIINTGANNAVIFSVSQPAPASLPDPFPSPMDMFMLGQMLGESSKVQNTECSAPVYTPSYDDSSSCSSSYDSGSSSSSYDSGSSYDSSSSCDSSSSSGSYD